MYAIIREGEGRFYTSTVFGYYRSADPYDYKSRFWIVLNKEKTALVKLPVLQPNIASMIPMLLLLNEDKTNWNTENDLHQSADFLPTDELPAMIDENRVPGHLLQRCISLDSTCRYEPMREVRTEKDLRDLRSVSGGFHDAHIEELKEENGSLYVLFAGTWGCRIEVWFEGDVSYDVTARTGIHDDPNWFESSLALHDGFVYLIDQENISPEHISQDCCWFKARNMKYHVIPD